MIRILIVLASVLFLSSCEKDINFDLKDAPNVLVVDANIENDKPPVVVLTKSFNFFDSINPSLLVGSFVHDAVVTMSNGTLTHQLKEFTVPLSNGYSYSYYTLDPANPATAFNGAVNTNYSLKIVAEGEEYNAITSIPAISKKPDSLWWKPAPFTDDTSKIVLMVKATDPPGLGNYIRYFTQKNSGNFLPGDNSVFDDNIIDGSTYQLQLDPGVDRNNKVDFDSNYFHRGDTITMKLCNIDKTTYTFWSTWEFAQGSIGNPFSQPNKVIGNISNGALGAFYGYAAYYKTLIVPK
ncbi:DUF4249 domain-containing protein [Ferruginibacter sp. SUN002]|uniref:DUF4249 domain-containing protein n=1 Tax=Ferruginibacter sp. SUN002 TaxID=2937789 RepID=UPI003D3670B6